MTTLQLPQSSKKVLEVLKAGGEMTHKDIVKKTHLASRTVRYALKKLKEHHLIIEKFNFRDARSIIYQNRPVVYPHLEEVKA
ncbi:MAG: winged helix-turn-helix transcriptional regulator [Methanoregula sp.]|jgi:predicted transcriptional regulator